MRGCSLENNACDVFEKIGGNAEREGEREKCASRGIWRFSLPARQKGKEGRKRKTRNRIVVGRIRDANAPPKFSPESFLALSLPPRPRELRLF